MKDRCHTTPASATHMAHGTSGGVKGRSKASKIGHYLPVDEDVNTKNYTRLYQRFKSCRLEDDDCNGIYIQWGRGMGGAQRWGDLELNNKKQHLE